MPPFCITKSEVMKMKAAQPFILIVVQMGSTKRDTLGGNVIQVVVVLPLFLLARGISPLRALKAMK